VRRRVAFLAGTLAFTLITGVLHFATDQSVATFLLAGVSLAGLAWIVGIATESVGARYGPAATGVLQSTLGNLPELFVVLFALHAGHTVVAQTSILGSLFANALLVLGLAIVAGARAARDGEMRFNPRQPSDTVILLQLAVFIIVLLGLSDRLGDAASRHQEEISVVGAIALLLVYASWLSRYLRGGGGEAAALEDEAAQLPFSHAIALLAAAGVGAALVSDWFVTALGPAIDQLGISEAFTGLVIVAIAGNAVENVVGVTLAAKGKSDLSISVITNSVSQIAVFLFPTLVLLSLFFADHLTFVVNPVYIGALAIMALAVWQITLDGAAAEFEGWSLVALYAILATVTWFE
jgi:Ca2+:H+ antiporter